MQTLKQKTIRYVITILIILTFNFVIPRIMPGDPTIYLLGDDAIVDRETVEALKKELGLDQPLYKQFIKYCRDLSRFHLGYSYHFQKNVSEIILARLPWTLGFLLPSVILGAIAGIYLGALAGWKKQNKLYRFFTHVAVFIFSIPSFFLAMVILFIFAIQLNIFPLKGFYQSKTVLDVLEHFVLPVLVLSLISFSRNFIIMRGSVILEKGHPYVLYARAKGVSDRNILFQHIFKNAVLPSISLIALDFGFLFSGALLVEIVFSLNGMGTLIYDAILSRDYPLLQGIFIIISLMVILTNLIADWIHQFLDPRIRKQK